MKNKCNREKMEEITLLTNKTVPFQNMYRLNTGFHVKIQGSLTKICNISLVRGQWYITYGMSRQGKFNLQNSEANLTKC